MALRTWYLNSRRGIEWWGVLGVLKPKTSDSAVIMIAKKDLTVSMDGHYKFENDMTFLFSGEAIANLRI